MQRQIKQYQEKRICKCSSRTLNGNFPSWHENRYSMWMYNIAYPVKCQIHGFSKAPPGHMGVSICALLACLSLSDFLEVKWGIHETMNPLIWALLALTEPNVCDSCNGWVCPGITVRQVKESPCTVTGPNCCPSAFQRIEGKLYWGRLFGDFVVPTPKIQVLRNEVESRNRQFENTQGLLIYIIHRSIFEKFWNTRKNNMVSVWGICRLLYTT